MELSLLLDIGSIATIVGLIIVVIELYLNQGNAKKDIELSKHGLAILSKLIESLKRSQESQAQLQREKLELKKREQEWSKFKDIAKAAGWLFEHLELEEE